MWKRARFWFGALAGRRRFEHDLADEPASISSRMPSRWSVRGCRRQRPAGVAAWFPARLTGRTEPAAVLLQA